MSVPLNKTVDTENVVLDDCVLIPEDSLEKKVMKSHLIKVCLCMLLFFLLKQDKSILKIMTHCGF